MAGALFENHRAESARFELNARLDSGTVYALQGRVDWSTSSGRAVTSVSQGPDSPITEVAWGTDVVVERIPELSELLTTLARPPAMWFARTPAPERTEIDRLIRIVAGLSSARRENPELLLQDDDVRWLRTDTLDGVEATVFRIGAFNRYWITDAGLLVRFEGFDSSGGSPIVVDFGDHGPGTIESPPLDDVIDTQLVADEYRLVIGR